MCAASKCAWDVGEVAFQGRFNVKRHLIVRASCVFDDFIGEGFQKIVDFVDSGCHVHVSRFLLCFNCVLLYVLLLAV